MSQIDSIAWKNHLIFAPERFADCRGFFSETFNRRHWSDLGLELDFVQDNHSRSSAWGVVRGLHFQAPPHAQDKLVRVTRGSILDVAVDIRKGSPTYGRHIAVELSAENWLQHLVPKGFAHGFCTLEPDCEVVYKVTDYYVPNSEGGLFWNDNALQIDWPFSPAGAMVSKKDGKLPLLKDFISPFHYDPEQAVERLFLGENA